MAIVSIGRNLDILDLLHYNNIWAEIASVHLLP